MALYRTGLTGKSRTAVWEKGATVIVTKWVRLRNIKANATFVLPEGVRLTGRVAVVNKSAVQQAAVTIGTAAAGTQISAGAVVAANSAVIANATALAPAYSGGDRTIYVESAAWQAKVHVLVEAEQWPITPDTDALS